MSNASDILREKGDSRSNPTVLTIAELRALADLLEATAAYIAWTEGAGHGESGHDAWLLMRNALAAAEAAITGATK